MAEPTVAEQSADPEISRMYCAQCFNVWNMLTKPIAKLANVPLCRLCSRPLRPLSQANDDPQVN